MTESSDDKNAEEVKGDYEDPLLSIQSNESDSKRFDPTKAESSFMLERGNASYRQKYFTVSSNTECKDMEFFQQSIPLAASNHYILMEFRSRQKSMPSLLFEVL